MTLFRYPPDVEISDNENSRIHGLAAAIVGKALDDPIELIVMPASFYGHEVLVLAVSIDGKDKFVPAALVMREGDEYNLKPTTEYAQTVINPDYKGRRVVS